MLFEYVLPRTSPFGSVVTGSSRFNRETSHGITRPPRADEGFTVMSRRTCATSPRHSGKFFPTGKIVYPTRNFATLGIRLTLSLACLDYIIPDLIGIRRVVSEDSYHSLVKWKRYTLSCVFFLSPVDSSHRLAKQFA